MNFKFMRNGIIIATVIGAVVFPVQKLVAANESFTFTTKNSSSKMDQNYLLNAVAEIQKQNNKKGTIEVVSSEEIKFNKTLMNKVFVNSEEGVVLVYAEPKADSDWVGKVYSTTSVKVTEKGAQWSAIESGNVVGFVKTEDLILGKDAVKKAKAILSEAYPESDILKLKSEEVEVVFTVGETKEEEAARLAAEEAARIAAEEARIAAEKEASRQKGADLVQYARKFLGNPYVYGGTSLTRGTDCSGFVKGVYKHYGISLPRTSYAMRSVGYKVSVSEIQPGDIVCYSGHVGIYAGNGQIINAIDEQRGIGMSDLRYKSIITVRRIF